MSHSSWPVGLYWSTSHCPDLGFAVLSFESLAFKPLALLVWRCAPYWLQDSWAHHPDPKPPTQTVLLGTKLCRWAGVTFKFRLDKVYGGP